MSKTWMSLGMAPAGGRTALTPTDMRPCISILPSYLPHLNFPSMAASTLSSVNLPIGCLRQVEEQARDVVALR